MTEPVDAWALQRLAILTSYLCAFTTAWKDRPFSTAYIDAFSGADYRSNHLGDSSQLGGFPALGDAPPKALLKYSARAVLATDPAFDGYVFIEQDGRRCRALETSSASFLIAIFKSSAPTRTENYVVSATSIGNRDGQCCSSTHMQRTWSGTPSSMSHARTRSTCGCCFQSALAPPSRRGRQLRSHRTGVIA